MSQGLTSAAIELSAAKSLSVKPGVVSPHSVSEMSALAAVGPVEREAVSEAPPPTVRSTVAVSETRNIDSIYKEHGPFLWASLHRLGVREADLPDCLQEVLVVVHRRLHTFDGTSKLTTWLFAICFRVAAAERRRAHVRREQLHAEPPEPSGEGAPSSPEDHAMRNDARNMLESVLDCMDLDKRAVFVMFELESMPCAEIAETLGVPVGTVHSRLHNARREFEKHLRRLQARSQPAPRSAAAEPR